MSNLPDPATQPVDLAREADLQLLQDFVNTNDLEGGRDQLDTPERLRAWLVGRGLLPPETGADASAHARAIAIREGIRTLGRANNGEELNVALVESLNRSAAEVPVRLALRPVAGDGAWSLEPGTGGIDAFLGRILGIVAQAMADGSWSRIKACRNDTCRWLFHDQSRNRSGTWCSMAICGSRMKARAYRARQREVAGA
ncbi:MAG TPA: CGNR zinc finger domain-containing protein [Candidatus Limnocylindrales bacterium]|nr:CGNR zinc finger domain-containing protein [Candidatus Limnocylindrales bacterium]